VSPAWWRRWWSARGLAKIAGISLANFGSGTSWRQALWTGCAMSPMSSIALLLVSQFVTSSMTLGPRIASIALPAILLMEILGAIIATFAIYRAARALKPGAASAQLAAGRSVDEPRRTGC
jgi:Kef-type K+ transport system membrane component KefB